MFASTVCCNILFITKSDKFMFDQKLRYDITNFTDKLETENSTNIIIIVIHTGGAKCKETAADCC